MRQLQHKHTQHLPSCIRRAPPEASFLKGIGKLPPPSSRPRGARGAAPGVSGSGRGPAAPSSQLHAAPLSQTQPRQQAGMPPAAPSVQLQFQRHQAELLRLTRVQEELSARGGQARASAAGRWPPQTAAATGVSTPLSQRGAAPRVFSGASAGGRGSGSGSGGSGGGGAAPPHSGGASAAEPLLDRPVSLRKSKGGGTAAQVALPDRA